MKLFKYNDRNKLLELAEKYSIQVIGYNEFMPLWYTLSCERESLLNSIEAANLFYETGLFESTEPELLYHDLLMSSDQYFQNQWGLKNVGQYCNTSDIDIRDFLNDDKVSMLQRSIELRKFTINNSGVFPFSLFQNKESYSFNSNTFNHKPTYKEEVDSLLNIILDNNDNLYIRDVSFLGFPSYHIYIPKISPIGRKTTQVDRENVNLNTNVRTDEIEDLFFPFESLISDNTKLNKLVEIIASPNQKDISEVKMCDLLKLEFKAEFYWSTIPASFFLVLFYYILKDYKSSVSYLDIFLESTKNEKDPYYQNIRKYLNYLSLGQDNEYIKKEIPSEIINTFKDNSSLFANIGIPHCPDCGKCLLKDNCLTFGKVDYSIRINNKMKENFIDQNNLKILKIN